MKLQIMSDLHLEFRDLSVRHRVPCDVVVLAGDLDIGHNGIDWINWRFPKQPVVYVLGNHEYYRHALPELTDELRRATFGTHIHVLENSAVELRAFPPNM